MLKSLCLGQMTARRLQESVPKQAVTPEAGAFFVADRSNNSNSFDKNIL